MNNRREFLKGCLVGGSALLVVPGSIYGKESGKVRESHEAWSKVPEILARIKPPVFPERSFEITRYGAIGDGKTDCTEAIRKAVNECNAKGGGKVVVPSGQYLTGPIYLKSNVNLHVTSGATILFTRETAKYPLVFTRWEGMELMNYSPFIYAFEEENVAITGKGTIDGNCDCEHWWPWKGRTNCGWTPGAPNQEKDRNLLFDMAERGAPPQERIFGEGHYLRPQFIQPYRCKNVLIEGVRLLRAPMWQVHPVLCRNVTIQDLYISSFGPNTDGCDPESCTDVLIKDTYFDTGDDCIAIKAGRNADGRRVNVPSENIVIQNCRMKDGHGGVTIGSEISGGVRNVFAERCQMDSPNLDIAFRIKNNAMRGGLLENIYVRDIEVGQVAFAGVSIDDYYEEGENGKFTPVVRNVDIRNLRSRKSKYPIYIRGFKHAPVENVEIHDSTFDGATDTNVLENVRNLKLQNVRVNGQVVQAPASTQSKGIESL